MSKPPAFPYQEWGFQKLVKLMKTALIATMGTGKTRIIIEALERLGKIEEGPILVLCTGPAFHTWKDQFPMWAGVDPVDIHFVRGSPKHRALLWEKARVSQQGIYITNYSIFLRDFVQISKGLMKRKPFWSAMVADEYHKYMRKHNTKTFKRFASLARPMECVFLLSGSPVRKFPNTLWTAFHIANPQLFSSYWRFTKTFCILVETGFGNEIVGLRNVERLKEVMDRHLTYIPEEVVASQQPKGKRNIMSIEMTPPQAKMYDTLVDETIVELSSGHLMVNASPMSIILRLRQLLCCPKLIDESLDWGGGVQYIEDRLTEDPHVLIFVPFRDAVDLLVKYFQDKGYSAYGLKGSMDEDEFKNNLAQAKRSKGILICTIAYGESFDYETAKTTYFLGYDYSLDVNQQAEGRTKRAISQHRYVTWNYLQYTNTIDEYFIEDIRNAYTNTRRVLTRPQEMINLLRKGRPE